MYVEQLGQFAFQWYNPYPYTFYVSGYISVHSQTFNSRVSIKYLEIRNMFMHWIYFGTGYPFTLPIHTCKTQAIDILDDIIYTLFLCSILFCFAFQQRAIRPSQLVAKSFSDARGTQFIMRGMFQIAIVCGTQAGFLFVRQIQC